MPKPKNQRTPEEEKRVQEAQAFIQQREKLASQRGGDNIGAVREAGRALIPQEDVRVVKEAAIREAKAKEQQITDITQMSPEELANKTGVSTLEQKKESQARTDEQNKIFKLGGIPQEKGVLETNKVTGLKSTAARWVEWVRIATTGKKPLDIQQSEGAFNDYKTAFETDLGNIKLGGSSRMAKENLAGMQQAVYNMEKYTDGLSKNNLRYWKDNGAEVLASIANMKSQIVDYYRQLALAQAGIK